MYPDPLDKLHGWYEGHPLGTKGTFIRVTAGPRQELLEKLNKKPKCPRCLNKKPARITCDYCGGMGRVMSGTPPPVSIAGCYVVHLYCQLGCNWRGTHEYTGETRHQAIKAAKKDGWFIEAGVAICPSCTKGRLSNERFPDQSRP